MSARIVCSGTRPSLYISRRLISPPPRRPEHWIFTPAAPEGDAVGELLGDRLRDELRVELRPLDLVDVDVDVLLGERMQVAPQRVDLDAGLADHDPGARGVDVDRDPLLVLADQDVGQARVRKLVVDVL